MAVIIIVAAVVVEEVHAAATAATSAEEAIIVVATAATTRARSPRRRISSTLPSTWISKSLSSLTVGERVRFFLFGLVTHFVVSLKQNFAMTKNADWELYGGSFIALPRC